MIPEIEVAAAAIMHHSDVVCLTGAGMSVESGIRSFRGPGGLWTEHGEPALDDYQRFVHDPKRYWEELIQPEGFIAELHSALRSAHPHVGHVALAEMERLGLLAFTITQNIDDLHRQAGSQRLAEIHGNYSLVRCLQCGRRAPVATFNTETLPPHCSRCGGLLKSDIVVFGEPIPDDVAQTCIDEIDQADCLLMVGTSAYVYPAAGFPRHVKAHGGTIIEVGPHPTEISGECDIVVRGTAVEVLPRLLALMKERLGTTTSNG
ncbi:NAD-dependent deacetylase [Chloroflexota bacterium]